jgi:hypothetical protein
LAEKPEQQNWHLRSAAKALALLFKLDGKKQSVASTEKLGVLFLLHLFNLLFERFSIRAINRKNLVVVCQAVIFRPSFFRLTK